jgi:hypothetical protein
MIMSSLSQAQEMPYTPAYGEQRPWQAPEHYQERGSRGSRGGSGLVTGFEIGALVVVGLGLVAWYYLGADLRRYMKMRSM